MTYKVKAIGRKGTFRVFDDNGSVSEIDAFLHAAETRCLSPATVRAYAYSLAAVYRWLAGTGRMLEQLEQGDLHSFADWELKRNANPKSINRRLIACGLLYKYHCGKSLPWSRGSSMPSAHYRGSGRDRIIGSRLLGKKRPAILQLKEPRRLITPLESEQVRQFLRSLRRYRDLAIVYLMLLCGLRSREIRTLTRRSVALDMRRIRVLGKGNKERMLPMADLAALAIEQYLTYERPYECVDDTLFVCLNGKRAGQPLSADGLRKIFRTRRKKSLLHNANPHRFRHTFGADMARSGVSLPVVQRLMGHANPETTLMYINLSMDDLADVYFVACARIEKKYDLE